jgi:hypothetical protein
MKEQETTIGKFTTPTSKETPAPLRDWLNRELPDCATLNEVAKGVWEKVNKMLKKDVDQYLFELVKNEFRVFKNGKKVVEVKQVTND